MPIITRKVVDSNQLRSQQLEDYLSKSKTNFAVLPDYASMEAYKGDTLVTIYESMALLSKYLKQVIVLKTTGVVCGLSGRGSGLQRRLIDESQSKEFGIYCQRLADAKAGNAGFQRQLLELGTTAKTQLERMLNDAHSLPEIFDDIAKSHTKDELKVLRSGKPYTNPMIKTLMENVLRMAVQLFKNHPNVRVWPDRTSLPNHFIFRSSLCAYLLALEWISVGGAQGVRPDKLRNDMVDVSFAAYGTYFDGLLSKDEKVQRIHYLARVLLSVAFGCQISGMP